MYSYNNIDQAKSSELLARISVICFLWLMGMGILNAQPLDYEKLKVISRSPSNQVEIFTIVPVGEQVEDYTYLEKSRAHAAGRIVYSGIYLKDKRNKLEVWYNLNVEDNAAFEAKVKWAQDSNSFTILYGDAKTWTEKLFVSQLDGRSKQWIFEEPRLPDVLKIILSKTKEPNAVFNLPRPIEVEKGVALRTAHKWVATLPEILKSETQGQEIEFRVVYYLMNENGGRLAKTWHYECIFLTKDWCVYDLKKISRIGKAPSGVYKAGHKAAKPLVLYEKTVKASP